MKKRKIWFIADSHFGHGNIIKYCNRPFLTKVDSDALEENGGTWENSRWRISRDAIDMMNDDITDNINELVGEDDTLWHLGDWAFAPKNKYQYKCEFYRNRIKCKNINLIVGNHDEPDQIRHLFNEVHHLHEFNVNKQKIILCHYAMAVFNKSHRGSIQLYGHSHSGAENWMNHHMKGRRSMDVGVDNIKKLFGKYRPISLDEVMDLMSNKKGHSMDHKIR